MPASELHIVHVGSIEPRAEQSALIQSLREQELTCSHMHTVNGLLQFMPGLTCVVTKHQIHAL